MGMRKTRRSKLVNWGALGSLDIAGEGRADCRYLIARSCDLAIRVYDGLPMASQRPIGPNHAPYLEPQELHPSYFGPATITHETKVTLSFYNSSSCFPVGAAALTPCPRYLAISLNIILIPSHNRKAKMPSIVNA